MEAIVETLQSFGFPALACGAVAWYVKYLTDQNMNETTEMRREHAEEISKLTLAINNNTLVIQKLAERLGMDHEQIDDGK